MGRSRFHVLPAPIGGLNASDPLVNMSEEYAIILRNYIPQAGWIEVRKGSSQHLSGISGGGLSTPDGRNLMSFKKSDASEVLLLETAVDLFNVTTTAGTALISPGTTNRVLYQSCEFKNKLHLVNGMASYSPRTFDGTTLATPSWTSSDTGFSSANFIQVWPYRGSLYFVVKNSRKAYYGGLEAESGAVKAVDFDSFFTQGGYLLFNCTTTSERNGQIDEMYVAVSSEGEVLIYQGLDPSDSTWSLVGRYKIPKPFGRQSFFYMNGELYIITRQGILAISTIMSNVKLGDKYKSLSEKIDPLISLVAQSSTFSQIDTYTSRANMVKGIVDDDRHLLFINIPNPTDLFGNITSALEDSFFVMNTQTGAWTQFLYPLTNYPLQSTHYSMAIFGGFPYYTATNTELSTVSVYKGNVGTVDHASSTAPITAFGIANRLMQAFSALGRPFEDKRLLDFVPYSYAATGGTINFGADTDFEFQSNWANITLPTGYNRYAKGINGTGRVFALNISGSATDSFQYSASLMRFEEGA